MAVNRFSKEGFRRIAGILRHLKESLGLYAHYRLNEHAYIQMHIDNFVVNNI